MLSRKWCFYQILLAKQTVKGNNYGLTTPRGVSTGTSFLSAKLVCAKTTPIFDSTFKLVSCVCMFSKLFVHHLINSNKCRSEPNFIELFRRKCLPDNSLLSKHYSRKPVTQTSLVEWYLAWLVTSFQSAEFVLCLAIFLCLNSSMELGKTEWQFNISTSFNTWRKANGNITQVSFWDSIQTK